MAEHQVNIKESAHEWDQQPPEFHHNTDFNQGGVVKRPLQKENPAERKSSTSDLTMDFLLEQEKRNQIRNIVVESFDKVGDHVVYNIDIHIKERSWSVARRYREFHRLHEQLVQQHGLAWELLPPKKIVGNLSSSHLEKRKVALQKYLKTVVTVFTDLPRPLIGFLEIDQFDVHAVCQQLSRDMYEIGDDLLSKGLVFKISPLQIHCINRRLHLPLPTCESQDPAEDIGHLYSFIQQVPRILVFPGFQKNCVGSEDITYDLSIFRSLDYLEIQCCDIEYLEGIEAVQKCTSELRVHKSIQLLKDILIGAQCWEQGVLMTVSTQNGKEDRTQITERFPSWKKLKRASFSYNDIRSIDYSMTLLPSLECLDLSHNLLTEVEYLEELTFLTDLNLSYNEMRHLSEFPYKLPSISFLNLAGNGIQNIDGLDKLYCLEKLNISNNRMKRVKDVLPLGNLPLLRRLRVVGNPFAETGNYRTRILGQFGGRAGEVVLDGIPTSNREMNKIKEIVASQDSYDIVEDEPYPSTVSQSSASSYAPSFAPPTPRPVSPLLPTVASSQQNDDKKPTSPRTKRKERIPQITNRVSTKDKTEDKLEVLENEDEQFRQKIEKLREHAGESWLTVYNEMNVDQHQQQPQKPQMNKQPASPSTMRKRNSKKVKNKEEKHQNETAVKETKNEGDCEPKQKQPSFARLLSVEAIDLELSDELRAEIKRLIRENVHVFEETYLVSSNKDEEKETKEYLIAVDVETNLLSQINFETGSTVKSYYLNSIRGVQIFEDGPSLQILQFEAKQWEKNNDIITQSHSLVKFTTKALKDCAGLYLILKSCAEGRRTVSKIATIQEITSNVLDNPYKMPKDILMAFFQNFIRKASSASPKKNENRQKTQRQTSQQQHQHTDYENINIEQHSFLKHVENTDSQQQQTILSVLWVGCLPYLFPDEEIPVAVVTTSLNIFLFRVFHPADDELDSKETPTFNTVASLEEAMHCFYSFPLKSLREVVVGLFDQGLRLEVSDEGPRGTFVLLTRDANKTGQFLDVLTSLVSIKTGVQEESNAPVENQVSIVYPDESKINALKAQLQEQEISPLGSRENLISYCIVYQIRENNARKDAYDDVTSVYLRSMILTNLRIFLCDEDYVHWPLPSYIHSAPFTPQWVVDDVNKAESVIGVDLWEEQKHSLRGSYGLSLTFEGNTQQTPSSDLKGSTAHVWNMIFQSLSEREQLVRSLASIWKNSFGQDLKVTKSNVLASTKSSLPLIKGHAKKPSGNIAIPSHQSIDSPEMFTSIDRARLNELFRNKIAQGDDVTTTGVQYVACVGCKPYKYPDIEIPVAVLLGKYKIYLICGPKNRKFLLANTQFEDQESSTSLYLTSIEISDLQQVVVGLFDQCLRLETGYPECTFVLVTRDFDRTNELIQRLSQAILALPKQMKVLENDSTLSESRETTAEIFQLYKSEDESGTNYYPKSEFIHPNSSIKFVYPSDDLLEKLRVKIQEYIQLVDLFPTENDFGILLYALVFQKQNELETPFTFVISETFLCLIMEDHVGYPLPLFVKELPDRSQYELSDVRLISSLVRVEFSDFHSGELSLIFNACAVDPSKYGDRFKMGSVEDDYSYVTDVNAIPNAGTETSKENAGNVPGVESNAEEDNILRWQLRAHSYAEREKIFDMISKMWTNIFTGKSLPVIRVKS
ncbi:nischarin-like isoform X2 [Clytia hemisphaerica]|uniref:PX domain-containing protein n=1 Tax=Clytia hemisphaerica TaxID=252671 RepID=A0A7M5UQW2_9CNID